jgi:hypothetical protein
MFEVLPDGAICFLVFFQNFPQNEAFLVLSGPEEIGLTVHFFLVEVELVEKKTITSAYVEEFDVGEVASVDFLAHLKQKGLIRDLQFAVAVPAACRGGRGGLSFLFAVPVEEGRKEASLFLLFASVLGQVFFFFDEDSEEFFVIEYFFSHIQDVFEYFSVLVGADSEIFLVAVEDYLVGEGRDGDHPDIGDGDLFLEVVVVDEVKRFTADGQPVAVLVVGTGKIHDRHHIQKHFPWFQLTTHYLHTFLHTFLLHSAEL